MTNARTISHDARALTINGARVPILSGAIHYPRSTPGMWPDLMKRSRDLGLNAIETYVFWGLHERERGIYDFSGRLDLDRFIEAAAHENLDVILRIGPYVCAEINYGGLPVWLREVPGLQTRTWNEPFMTEMARWVRHIGQRMTPYLAGNGGPIILAQIENEYSLISERYGAAGRRYLQWSIDLGQTLELEIPWVMCFGGMPGAIETINAFYGHEQIGQLVERHPEQPILWTENWTGWYDTWGYPHHVRSAEDEAYAVARFIAAGGTGVNYYMWHGGTNFGRETTFLQTTSYDYDAPLDEFGLPTSKARHLAALHRALKPYWPLLLRSPRPAPRALADGVLAFDYADADGALTFVCNDAPDARTVTLAGAQRALPGKSALLMTGNRVAFATTELQPRDRIKRHMRPVTTPVATGAWAEPLPSEMLGAARPARKIDSPVEQLSLTRDNTDYCWYSTVLHVEEGTGARGSLTLAHAADIAHVFVDGALQATTTLPLKEDRGDLNSDATTQRFSLALDSGERRLDLLVCAIGLIKGDWMIGHRNMVDERKGIWGGVAWNDQPLIGNWSLRPGLMGEILTAEAAEAWPAPVAADTGAPLRWWRMVFDRPQGGHALAVDLAGMGKGLAWLNGECIGRFWSARAEAPSPRVLSAGGALRESGRGAPTQRYYHLPADWLQDGPNVLVLFDETGGDPSSIRICEWTEEPK